MRFASSPGASASRLEMLENRRLLAASMVGTTLVISGGAADDSIHVDRLDPATLRTTINGESATWARSMVRAIKVAGGGGNDRIAIDASLRLPTTLGGGNGNDTILGGAGADRIIGGEGDDVLNGRGGPDTIEGGGGKDLVQGGDGRDVLRGGRHNDRLYGGPGWDVLRGGPGVDRLDYGYGRVHRRSGGVSDSTWPDTFDDDSIPAEEAQPPSTPSTSPSPGGQPSTQPGTSDNSSGDSGGDTGSSDDGSWDDEWDWSDAFWSAWD